MAARHTLQFLARRAPQATTTTAVHAPARLTPQCAAVSRVGRHGAVAAGRWSVGQMKWHSTSTSTFPSNKRSKAWQYEDVLSLVQTPSSTTLLIDVREPAEFAANSIPTALNIPISSQPDALMLSAEDFEDRFGWMKPGVEKEVVFFCKAGVRSSAAAQLAKQAGYENVGEYRGSWLDWEKRGGPGTKTPPPAGGKGEGAREEIKE